MTAPPKGSFLLCTFLFWALNVGFASAYTSLSQFKDFYPQYGWIFKEIIHVNCTSEYDTYLTGYKNHSDIDYVGGGGIYTAITQPVVNCMLNNMSEYLKSTTTSAQVLLGVMPSVLALLGPSHDEIAMLCNIGRRPMLAMSLALACPSAYFSRAFEYADPKEILSQSKNRHAQWRLTSKLTIGAIASVEYTFAFLACLNVALNTHQVSYWAISSVSPDNTFLPGLWLGSGLLIHVFSCVVFRLRLQGWRNIEDVCDEEAKNAVQTDPSHPTRSLSSLAESISENACVFRDWLRQTPSRVKHIRTTEFTPCAADHYEVRIKTLKETKTFLSGAWIQSTLTIVHVIFGTLVFSSLLFVGVKDAAGIIFRYIAGVAVCRVILMYELAGLREKWTDINGKNPRESLEVSDIEAGNVSS